MDNLFAMPYQHQAFGLAIQSDLELLNLPRLAGSLPFAPVHIQSGALPAQLEGATLRRGYFQAAEGRLLVQVSQVGKLLIEKGESIRYEAQPGAEPAALRLALINLGLSVILHQRGALALHASAVATPGGAVLFCGERGAGKSTLAAALHQRGWSLVCDDKAALYPAEKERIQVIPSFPELRLWQDALEHLQMEKGNAEKNPGFNKFNLGLQEGFHASPLPLYAIYHLQPAETAEVEIKTLNGMEKFQVVRQNTYINQFLRGLGLLPNHFTLASLVAAQIPVYRVRRPARLNRLDALADLVDARLRQA
jgi:hypothetical protein